jgi:hypothetical protein
MKLPSAVKKKTEALRLIDGLGSALQGVTVHEFDSDQQ